MSTSAGLSVVSTASDTASDGAVLRLSTLDRTDHALRALGAPSIETDAGGLEVEEEPRRIAPEPPGMLSAWAALIRNASPLMAVDFVMAAGATLLSAGLVGVLMGGAEDVVPLYLELTLLAPALLMTYATVGLYPGVGMGPVVELRKLSLSAVLVTSLLALVLLTVSDTPLRLTATLGLTLAILLPTLAVARGMVRNRLASTTWWGDGLVVLGGGPEASRLLDRLQQSQDTGLRPVGVIDDYHRHWDAADPDEARWYLGPPETVGPLLASSNVRWAVVTPRGEWGGQGIEELLDQAWVDCIRSIPHRLVLTDSTLPSLWAETRECGGAPAIHLGERLLCPTARLTKRAIDLAVCLAGGIIVCPLLLLISLLVRCTSRGPIYYAQDRVGMNGETFRVWKFRSMVQNADEVLAEHLAKSTELQAEWDRDRKLKRDPRITSVGRWLRKTSLDELPQIWNVLCGEMSLVGPRPLPVGDEVKYGSYFVHYIRVRPGITGLWQVSGRNNTTYDERVAFDTYYARNWSPWLDLHILLRTFRTVLLCEGAY